MILIAMLVAISAIIGALLAYRVRDSDVALDHTLEEMLDELPQQFEKAHVDIRIATDFDKRFFDNDRVKTALSNAVGRGVDVRIIAEAQPSKWYTEEDFKMRFVEKLTRHVTIIDRHNVRIEKPHTLAAFGQPGDSALLYKDFPLLASKWAGVFDRTWDRI